MPRLNSTVLKILVEIFDKFDGAVSFEGTVIIHGDAGEPLVVNVYSDGDYGHYIEVC